MYRGRLYGFYEVIVITIVSRFLIGEYIARTIDCRRTVQEKIVQQIGARLYLGNNIELNIGSRFNVSKIILEFYRWWFQIETITEKI